MAISRACRRIALLPLLAALNSCTQASPTDPAAARGESVVLAAAPVREEVDETFSRQFDCGSFTGLSSGRIDGYVVTFFDKDGNPVRLQFHLRYRATITNIASGKTLPDNAFYNARVDLLTGVEATSGVVYNVKDRETGIRIKDVGRLVVDGEGNVIFEAGQHDVQAGYVSPDPQYCAVLS